MTFRRLTASSGSAMADWIAIARADECPPGNAIERVAGDRVVALANLAGTFHALDGLCPHQGGPLGRGVLCGTVLTCPWHGWQFDVVSGRHQISPTLRQAVFEVRERGGLLEVRLPDRAQPDPGAAAAQPDVAAADAQP